MNDQDTTSQLPTPPPPPGGEQDSNQPKRLLRSRDRMLAGVAGGLGRYFDVDPVIFRIGFAISVFFGGLGALAYIALALFVPSEGTTPGQPEPAPVERSRGLAIAAGIAALIVVLSWGAWGADPFPFDERPWLFAPLFGLALVAGLIFALRGVQGRGPAGVLGRIALAIAVLALVGIAISAGAWAGATGHGVAVASVIVAIGVLLVAAALGGGGARWLIAPAVALVASLGFIAAADIEFSDGIGQRHYRPASLASLPDDGRYEIGIGRLAVDLRDLEWSPGTDVELNIDAGIGEAVVAVPESVCVTTDLEVKAGVVRVAGEESSGFDAESRVNEGVTGTPRLDLSGEVDLGALRVINDEQADINGHGRRWNDDDGDEDAMRAALDAACSNAERREDQKRRRAAKRRRDG